MPQELASRVNNRGAFLRAACIIVRSIGRSNAFASSLERSSIYWDRRVCAMLHRLAQDWRTSAFTRALCSPAPGSRLPLSINGGDMHSGMYGMCALQESVRQCAASPPRRAPTTFHPRHCTRSASAAASNLHQLDGGDLKSEPGRMADRCRREGQGPLGTQSVRPLGIHG